MERLSVSTGLARAPVATDNRRVGKIYSKVKAINVYVQVKAKPTLFLDMHGGQMEETKLNSIEILRSRSARLKSSLLSSLLWHLKLQWAKPSMYNTKIQSVHLSYTEGDVSFPQSKIAVSKLSVYPGSYNCTYNRRTEATVLIRPKMRKLNAHRLNVMFSIL